MDGSMGHSSVQTRGSGDGIGEGVRILSLRKRE